MKLERKLSESLLVKYINLYYEPEDKYVEESEDADLSPWFNMDASAYSFDFGGAAYDIPFDDDEEEEESESTVSEYQKPEEIYDDASYVSFAQNNINTNHFDLDKSFAEMLLYWIDKKNLKPSDVYGAANLNKTSFNNIINHPNVVPKKNTALACIIGLKLDIDEAEDLLKRAGYALSNSQLTDVIVRCYIEHRIYDIFEINEVLYEKDLALLGSSMNG